MSDNMPEEKKRWSVGVDFGTTNTYVVAYDEFEDKVYTNESVIIDQNQRDMFGNIPTAIAIDPIEKAGRAEPEEKILVGIPAIQKPWLRIFRDLKTAARTLTPPNGTFGKGEKSVEYPFRNCDLKASIQFGTDEYPIKKKVEDLLREYFQQIFGLFGIDSREIKNLVVGCPAVNGRNGTIYDYESTLKTTLQEIVDEKTKVEILPEPVLAGVTYLFGNDPSHGATTVLVIDIGGGTTDFSILTYEDGKPKSGVTDSCNVAGNAIDELIMNLLPDDFHANKIVCRRAKEQCFAKGENGMGDLGTYHGKSLYLTYESQLNDNAISLQAGGIEEQVFEKIWKKLNSVLDAHQGPPINNVFFVGGSSAIPQLIEYLKKTFKNYTKDKIDDEVAYETLFKDNQRKLVVPGDDDTPIKITPYNAVAIGACIEAYGEKCVLRPKIEMSSNIIGWNGTLLATKTMVRMMGKQNYTPICHVVVDPQLQNDIRVIYHNKINITWKVDSEEHNYKLTFETPKAPHDSVKQKSLLFVLKMRQRAKVEFCVYIETGKEPPEKSVSEWIDSNGLFEAAKQEYIKELIKAEEGQNNIVEINP